ncbi:ATP-binding cassette domain-containing protein [bacterium]|nr:ATP-binding cassette domain-containing protein [bacterium]
MIQLEHVAFSRGPKQVLRDINLSVQQGETLIITGRSGSGLTSVLEICAGLVEPDHGRVLWHGKPIRDFSKTELIQARTRMGYLFQNPALVSNLTVFDNVALPLRYHLKLNAAQTSERARHYLSLTGLIEQMDRLPEQLSGGQKRMTELARALVMKPTLLLMDEPGNALHPIELQRFIAIIEQVRQQYALTILATSTIIPIMKHLATRIALLETGILTAFHQERATGQIESQLSSLESYLRQHL